MTIIKRAGPALILSLLVGCGGSGGGSDVSGSDDGDKQDNNSAPAVTNLHVAITAGNPNSLKVNDVLAGGYTYSDAENDAEGETTYRWYLVDNGKEVELGDDAALTVPFSARGKTVNFSVTPRALTGTADGEAQTTTVTVQSETLLFLAKNSTRDQILYKTDGSAESITELKNFGKASVTKPTLLADNRWVFMTLLNTSEGATAKLYVTDGTAAGTYELINKDKPLSRFQGLRVIGEYAYFSARTTSDGQELWTLRWKDDAAEFKQLEINAGSNSSDPQNFTYAPELNAIFFTAFGYRADEVTEIGRELYILDLDDNTGPQIVKDIRPSFGRDETGSVPLHLTWFKNKLYFSAFDGSVPEFGSGRTLWTSDGTSDGTVMVKDLDVGSHSYPTQFTAVGDDLYFVSNDGSGVGGRLWVTRGTAESTVKVQEDLHGEANYLTAFPANNALIYHADTPTEGTKLWHIKTRNNNPSDLSIMPLDQSINPGRPFVKGNTLIYGNGNSNNSYRHLSSSVFIDNDNDLRETKVLGYITDESEQDAPTHITTVNGRVLFAAWAGNGANRELFYLEADGSGGPQLLKEFVPENGNGEPEFNLDLDLRKYY